jgi:hypothetical protein
MAEGFMKAKRCFEVQGGCTFDAVEYTLVPFTRRYAFECTYIRLEHDTIRSVPESRFVEAVPEPKFVQGVLKRIFIRHPSILNHTLAHYCATHFPINTHPGPIHSEQTSHSPAHRRELAAGLVILRPLASGFRLQALGSEFRV